MCGARTGQGGVRSGQRGGQRRACNQLCRRDRRRSAHPGYHRPSRNGLFVDTECGSDMFCPDQPIQRWVMAGWLIRALDQDPTPTGESRFDDIDSGQWWIRYAEQLAERQITLSCATDRLCPDRSVTRGQMASFLVRAFNLPPAGTLAGFTDTRGYTHQANIDALVAAGITLGCDTDPFATARPAGIPSTDGRSLTRALDRLTNTE